MLPQVTFLIPTFNHLPALQMTLKSLQASVSPDLNYQVVIVDDFSTDNTAAWLRSLSDPRIDWVKNDCNLGYGESMNRAANMARGEVLALLNSDLILAPGWLEPMFGLLHDPLRNIGLVGNVQRRVSGDDIDHAGVRLNLKGQFEHVTELPSHIGHAFCPLVTGACMLLRRSLFEELGGFDSRFRNGCEDFDLCFRVRERGKRIGISYQSVIRHHVSLSRGKHSDQDERNSRQLLNKWRKKIKFLLTQVWYTHLTHERSSLDDAEGFDQALLDHPLIASRLLAEQQLALQESRWSRMFDSVHSGSTTRVRPIPSGTEWCPSGLRPTQRHFNFDLGTSGPISSLNLCGSLSSKSPASALVIRLGLNGLHYKSFQIARGSSFNLQLKQPLTLPKVRNRLTVSIDGGAGTADALHFLVLNWMAIDREMFEWTTI
jgi:GT2 family glycosyltransferase